MDVYEALRSRGLTLPSPPPRGGLYVPVKQVGNLLFTAGCGSTVQGVPVNPGKVGADLTLEEGQAAARLCVLNLLAVLEVHLGDLNKIRNIVKLLGFVASAPDFYRQPEVMNAASQLLTDLFGDRGQHARSALGTNVLPGNIAVEIELICEI